MKKKALLTIYYTILLSLIVIHSSAFAATYYVATGGNDNNPGTLEQPFATINKGASVLVAGDMLYIRGGTYVESVTVGVDGTSTQRITISGYPGETATIDGQDSIPGRWGVLLQIDGDYITIQDLEVKDSLWMGIRLLGTHAEVINVDSHGHWENGILLSGDYGLADNCRVYNTCKSNINCTNTRGDWASALSAARRPTGCIIRNCTSRNNWGEGISAYESTGTLIEDNVIYDNYSVNLYISDAVGTTARRNLIYSTGAITCGGAQIGIALSSEARSMNISDSIVINNFVLNARRNFYFYSADTDGLVNTIIANNTFVNSVYEVNFKILSGNHSNTRIENNIILQEDSLPICNEVNIAGLTFSYNNWSKSPPSAASGTGDVVGHPELAKTGPTGPGELTGEWFNILGTSLARDQAKVISEVTEDFFGNARDEYPDMGAHEYGGSSSNPPGPPAGLRLVY